MAEYKFAGTLKKLALTLAKEKDEDGETYDVPKLTITLEVHDSSARGINARLSGYHGQELVVLVYGDAVQLSLG